MILKYILTLTLSFLLAFLFTPIVRNYFIKKKLVEDPVEKQKKTGNATALSTVPRGGGIPIFVAFILTIILLLPLDKHIIGIIIACTLTLIVGIFDDLFDISPKLRLFTNVVSAIAIVSSGIGIAYISNPFGGTIDLSFLKYNFVLFGQAHSIWIISDLLAIIWITWCTNIVGWSTGVDGQLPGFTAISALFIGFLGMRFSGDTSQWPVIILALALAGSYLGFLPYNIFPQSIMPGYSGKSLAGLLLAVLSILSGAKLATLLLILGIPMIDAVFVIIKRVRKKKSIFKSDNNHLHHTLLSLGWSRRQISVFYWGISFVLGSISLFLNSSQKFYTFIGIFILLFFFSWKLSRRI